MGRMYAKGIVTVLAVALSFAGGERSGSATMMDGTEFSIEYWAGTGANQAVMVVDFAATGGQSYSFGYRWDGTATGYDMVQSIAAAGDLDFTATTFPGFGTYIDNFTYGSEAGNIDFYWQYFTGIPAGGSVTWNSSMIGMGERVLADGRIDGWYNGFDPGAAPRVPEPTTALLAAAGLLAWRQSRAS